MKNQLIDIIRGLFIPSNERVLTTADTKETPFPIHDSVMVSTLVVKDNGESLLIKLPGTTPWLAEQGNTLLPAITRVFPRSFESIKKDMQVRYDSSYVLSLS
jgi:hypothetical protein